DVGADYLLDSGPVAYGGDVFLIDPPTHGRESMFRARPSDGLTPKSSPLSKRPGSWGSMVCTGS
ncbi:MAG TPA: hypothetical protein VHQ68_04995, partial [Propionibacteriaceae bacterium]|nr:hypothetical protein [Propionibacteriaceae bacterium]